MVHVGLRAPAGFLWMAQLAPFTVELRRGNSMQLGSLLSWQPWGRLWRTCGGPAAQAKPG